MITPLDFADLRPDLRAALAARYDRLGYLGDFFRHMAHQPDALIAFDAFTEACKHALPFDLAETISLTAATRLANDYERHQHERLAVRNGQARSWVADVEALHPDDASTALSADQRAVQRYVLAAIADLAAAAAGRGADDRTDSKPGRGSATEAQRPAGHDPTGTGSVIDGSPSADVLDIIAGRLGDATAAAVALLTARFIGHATVSRACRLLPSVPSIFDPVSDV